MHMAAPFDLAIIGGGINGYGIARDAAGRGLAVYLCEMGDLASGTSSIAATAIEPIHAVARLIPPGGLSSARVVDADLSTDMLPLSEAPFFWEALT